MKTSYKIIHAIFAGIIRCVLRIHVSGAENDLKYDEGVLLCANHVSLLDPVTICASIRHTEPLFMSKKELFKVPVVRHIIRAFGAYPVERGGADMGAMKKTIELISEGNCVGIFPQGTRCRDKRIRDTKFKSGAALIAERSGASVLPVCIKIKKNHWVPFRRIDVIIGSLIKAEEIAFDAEKPRGAEHDRITGLIFDRICELGGEAE